MSDLSATDMNSLKEAKIKAMVVNKSLRPDKDLGTATR